MELSEAIKRIINQFGKDVLTEERFVNILADEYHDRDNPALFGILRTMVKDGCCSDLLACDKNNIKNFINKSILALHKKNGYDMKLVEDIFNSVAVGSGVVSLKDIEKSVQTEPTTPSKQTSQKLVKPVNQNLYKPTPQLNHKQPASKIDTKRGHKDISLYSGEELMVILVDYFMLPLKSGYDGSVQETSIKQMLGDEEGLFILDYFLKMEVVKWSSDLHSYYATNGNAKEFISLHEKAFIYKEPLAIAKHILRYTKNTSNVIDSISIRTIYKCSDSVADVVLEKIQWLKMK